MIYIITVTLKNGDVINQTKHDYDEAWMYAETMTNVHNGNYIKIEVSIQK